MGVNEKLIWTESMKTASAAADFSSKQYYGAKLSGDREIVLVSGNADIPVGLVLNNPAHSKDALVLIVGRAPGVGGESISAGDKVRIGSDGKVMKWITANTTYHCVGQCVEGADTNLKVGVFNFSFPNAIDIA